MQNNEMLRLINAYAMRNGIMLGLWGILTLTVFKYSFTIPLMSTLYGAMLLGSPVLATFLTIKFRGEILGERESFSYLHAFLHTLLMGFYASIWIALFIYVYLQFFDHGTFFENYGNTLNSPEMQQYIRQTGLENQMQQITGSNDVNTFVDILQSFGAANYAALELYTSLFISPIISAIIAIFCKRK